MTIDDWNALNRPSIRVEPDHRRDSVSGQAKLSVHFPTTTAVAGHVEHVSEMEFIKTPAEL